MFLGYVCNYTPTFVSSKKASSLATNISRVYEEDVEKTKTEKSYSKKQGFMFRTMNCKNNMKQ